MDIVKSLISTTLNALSTVVYSIYEVRILY